VTTHDRLDARDGPATGALSDLADIPVTPIWEGAIARRVRGDRLELVVLELAPNAQVPEHRHPQDQHGIVIEGTLRFRVGDEERDLGPGGTWRVPGGVPHAAVAGPAGAVAIDVFAPVRDDWDGFGEEPPRTPRWPGSAAPKR
jgi:quercetin dioxygenase-like cupin family protein